MTEIFLFILVLGSLIGMAVILYRKIPVLVQLPESSENLPSVAEMIEKSKERSKEEAKKITGAAKINHELYLQKILSKIRVLTLKTEHKTGTWLEKLRQKNNNHLKDDYWQELKKAKNGKKPA